MGLYGEEIKIRAEQRSYETKKMIKYIMINLTAVMSYVFITHCCQKEVETYNLFKVEDLRTILLLLFGQLPLIFLHVVRLQNHENMANQHLKSDECPESCRHNYSGKIFEKRCRYCGNYRMSFEFRMFGTRQYQTLNTTRHCKNATFVWRAEKLTV